MEKYRGTKNNPYHISCGGLIYRKKGAEIEVLLLHRFKKDGWEYNSWHLPKGTRRANETEEETTKREILEETGYQVEVGEKIGSLQSTYIKEGVTIYKKTHYFLCRPKEKIEGKIGEHDEIQWVSLSKAIKLLSQFPKFEKEEKILLKFQQKKEEV